MRVFAAAARSDLAGSRELPPAREVLGSDHPLSRATEACRVLRLQLIGTAAWTASMTAWGVAAPPVSITVLAAGVTVVGLLSAALLFARTMRAERARDLIADGCVPSLSSEVAAES